MTTDRFFASKPGRRRAPVAFALVLSLSVGALVAAHAASAAPTGLWGIYDQPPGYSIQPFVNAQGRNFALITQHVNIGDIASFPTAAALTAKAEGAVYAVGINPYVHTPSGPTCIAGGNAAVAAGTYDAQLRAWKAVLDALGTPYLVAWNLEPSTNTVCGPAADFVAAFDHVAGIFGAQVMFWDMAAGGFRSGQASAYQPKDYAYLGVDGYGTSNAAGVFDAALSFAASANKPVLIRSVGITEGTNISDAQAAAFLTDCSNLFIAAKVWGVAWDMSAFSGPLSSQAFVTASQQPYWGGAGASPSPTVTSPSPDPPSPSPSVTLPSPSPTLPSPSPSPSVTPGWAPGTRVTCSGSVQSNSTLSLTCAP